MTADRKKRRGVLSERERERFAGQVIFRMDDFEAAVLRAAARRYMNEWRDFNGLIRAVPDATRWLRERARSLR